MIARQHNIKTGSHASNSRKRILIVGESVCLAHVGRPAMLARWAKAKGYAVTFACGSAFAQIAKNEGLISTDLCTVKSADFFSRLNSGQFFYTATELDAYMHAERNLIRSVQPDLIVGDFRLTLSASAELENVPMLSLLNSHWSPGHPCPLPAPYAGFFKRLSPRIRNFLFKGLRPSILKSFAKPIDDVRHRNGLARLHDARKLYSAGDACAYLDAPEFMAVPNVPAGHFYLGPLVWKPRTPINQKPIRIPDRHPLVYVSMGSSGNTSYLSNILRALEKTSYHVFLSGIDQLQADRFEVDFPKLRGRLHARKLIDPSDILKKAQLTICHGGSGTVYQSLLHGVPLLCLPTNLDQGLIAQTVEDSGLGLNVFPEQTSVTHFSSYLKLFPGRFKRPSRQIALALQSGSPEKRWLRWLGAYFDGVRGEGNNSLGLHCTDVLERQSSVGVSG